MLRWDQARLAQEAHVAVDTVRRLEAIDGTLRATLTTLRRLEDCLAFSGVDFLPGGAVRLRDQPAEAAS